MPREELNRAVGTVSQNAAQLEATVAIVTWGLAGLEQYVARIVVPNGMDTMLGLIKNLLPARVENEDLRQRVTAWCGEVRIAYTDRNLVVHSIWVPNGDDSFFRAHLKKLKPELEVKTLDQMMDVAAKLELLATKGLSEFIDELIEAAPGPWSAGPTSQRPNP